MNTALTGAFGELTVGRYLRENGYNIIASNYRCRFGEIDIIAGDRHNIMFVEVKTRSNPAAAIKAADAVDAGKIKRIIAAANFFLTQYETKLQPRFDVAEVYVDGTEVKKLNYIKNAYSAD